jgi:hypothetical protein
MGVPTSEVGYTSVTAGMGDHEVRKGHVVALKKTCTQFCASKATIFTRMHPNATFTISVLLTLNPMEHKVAAL